jgi:diguanylate cyclase (GGDEF)-like protein/PAS domain S-box-containing protein
MVCATDPDGYLTRVNPAFEQTLGYSSEELLSQALTHFVHPDDVARTREELEAVIAGQASVAFEIRCRCKDGGYKWLHWNAVPDPSGSRIYAVARDVTAQKQLEAQLAEAALRDPVTGIPNRRHLERVLDLAGDETRSTAVLVLDLDHFKQVNDTFGHSTGDLVLKQFAELLQAHMRPTDIACRFGGEEFVAVMNGVSRVTALQRAQAICEAVRRVDFLGMGTRLTVSVGVAVAPDEGPSARAVLPLADAAMYAAKRLGRDRVMSAKALADLSFPPDDLQDDRLATSVLRRPSADAPPPQAGSGRPESFW